MRFSKEQLNAAKSVIDLANKLWGKENPSDEPPFSLRGIGDNTTLVFSVPDFGVLVDLDQLSKTETKRKIG